MQPTQAQNPVPGNSDSIFEKVSKTVVGGMLNMVNTGQVASGDRPAMSAGDVGTRKIGQGVSYLNNTLNPYSNTTNNLLGVAAGKPDAANKLIKSSATDVALMAAGYGIGKGVQGVVAGKYVNPVAAAANKIRGESIMVVGTKSDDVPTVINKFGNQEWARNPLTKGDILPTVPDVVRPPQTIHPALKDTPVRWGFDPATSGTRKELVESVTEYADRWYLGSNQIRRPYGSDGGIRMEFGGWTTPEIAVTRVPTKSMIPEPVVPSWQMNQDQVKAVERVAAGGPVNDPLFRKGGVVSTSPAKVVSSVSPVNKDPSYLGAGYIGKMSPAQVEAALVKAIKRAGGKVPKR